METDILILSVTMVGMVTMFLLKRNSKKKFEERMAESELKKCEAERMAEWKINHKGKTCSGMGFSGDKWY
jgi:hypothetical protein